MQFLSDDLVQPDEVIDPVFVPLAPGHQFLAAEAGITVQDDLRCWSAAR
jgi:hypothetical protein